MNLGGGEESVTYKESMGQLGGSQWMNGSQALGRRGKEAYFEHAKGSSQEPGTDWMIMFASLTPSDRSFVFAFFTKISMIAVCVSEDSEANLEQLTRVPTGVDDANAERTAIELIGLTWSLQ